MEDFCQRVDRSIPHTTTGLDITHHDIQNEARRRRASISNAATLLPTSPPTANLNFLANASSVALMTSLAPISSVLVASSFAPVMSAATAPPPPPHAPPSTAEPLSPPPIVVAPPAPLSAPEPVVGSKWWDLFIRRNVEIGTEAGREWPMFRGLVATGYKYLCFFCGHEDCVHEPICFDAGIQDDGRPWYHGAWH